MTPFRTWMLGLSAGAIATAIAGHTAWLPLWFVGGAAITTWGVSSPRSCCFGPVQWKLSQHHAVALTFDDGPNPDITPKVLEILEAHNAKATFFVIGSQVERFPELLQQISSKGHAIGHHSYTHSAFTNFQSYSNSLKDFQRSEELIFNLLGQKIKLFRPPMGLKNPTIFKAIRELDYRVVTWSCSYKANSVLRDGDIVLFHDGYHLFGKSQPHFKTPALLESALKQIQAKGWTTEVLI